MGKTLNFAFTEGFKNERDPKKQDTIFVFLRMFELFFLKTSSKT